MTPMFPTEPKSCGIRRAVTPVKGTTLSTRVAVLCAGERFKAPIHYSEYLVDIVGHALPVGVAEDHPAFLRLVNIPATSKWRLFALYSDRSAIAYLWMYDSCPTWVNLPKHLR